MGDVAAALTVEERQFDFWLGAWRVTWGDGLEGRNRIERRLGRVIVEEFDGRPGVDLLGHSVSVYDRDAACWKQTWVDSEGGYIDLVGGLAHGRMELFHEREAEGERVRFRMLFDDISEDGFDWTWSRLLDGAWATRWAIRYERLEPPAGG
ncbi:MAG: hypothetical protein OEW31_01050 [Thermoleophilia bacterium]|nr:hypothetical protein [Thermoleophilia bacterium]MDH4344901.1 hypothetical protein [Thermoleophilia bacterium]